MMRSKKWTCTIETRRKASNICSVLFLVLKGRNDVAMGESGIMI